MINIASADLGRVLLLDYAVIPYALLLVLAVVGIELLRRAKISESARQAVILTASLSIIAFLDPRSALLITMLATVVYWVVHSGLEYKKTVPLLTAMSVLGLISAKTVFANWSPAPIALMGLSYYVLRLVSVLIEVGRKNPDYMDIKALPFFTYVFFIPIFFAGPVQRYADFRTEPVADEALPWLYTRIAVLILLKISVLDFLLLQAVILPIRTELVPAVASWPFLERMALFFGHGFISIVYHYFDFVIYTEIAKATGRLLGYHVIDNFNYPLLVTNIAEFWRRWHMSMSHWARDYVFVPVMMRSRRIWLGSYVTMMMIGLWHTVNLNWFVWALAHGSALVFYDRLRRSSFYKIANSTPATARALGMAGWIATLSFISAVNNLVAFPLNYAAAWRFARQALLGLP